MDLDAFVERAAIKQYDGGLSRFLAETEAAAEQGHARWEMIHALRKRDSATLRHLGEADVRHGSHDLPAMQCRAPEEDRPLPQRDLPDRRGGLEMLARELRLDGGRVFR